LLVLCETGANRHKLAQACLQVAAKGDVESKKGSLLQIRLKQDRSSLLAIELARPGAKLSNNVIINNAMRILDKGNLLFHACAAMPPIYKPTFTHNPPPLVFFIFSLPQFASISVKVCRCVHTCTH